MSDLREGGCQCGAVRYCIEGDPVALIVCHCTDCQKQSGSAFGMSLIVPRASFKVTTGRPEKFSKIAESGNRVDCMFCAECGTRLFHVPAVRTETLNLKPGTLDDTAWLAPVMHVWTRSKQPWVSIPGGVRQLETQP